MREMKVVYAGVAGKRQILEHQEGGCTYSCNFKVRHSGSREMSLNFCR